MNTHVVFALLWVLAVSGNVSSAKASPSDYESWETENGITGAGPAADSDGDGIVNGIEFVIGGDPSGPNSNSNSLLPTVTVDSRYLNFAYRRANAAAGCNLFAEYSSSLGSWTMAEPGENGIVIEEDVGAEVAVVTVRIPRALASGSGLFARLGVEIAP